MTTTVDAGPSRLERVGAYSVTWHHQMRPGRDWRDALRPEYWFACCAQLGPLHRIEVSTADHKILFEIIVAEVNPHSTPTPRLDLFFRPIMPANLDLPAEPVVRPSRWVATQMATGGAWRVDDLETGQPVQQNMHRTAAMELVGHLEAVAGEMAQAKKSEPGNTGLGRDRAPA